MFETNIDFVIRVLKAVENCDSREDLWWSTKNSPSIQFTINCDDLFYYGSGGDSEEITPYNIEELEKTISDIKSLIQKERDKSLIYCAPLLFAARMRKMRPHGLYYISLKTKTWELFDACGPERDGDAAKTNLEKQIQKEIEWEAECEGTAAKVIKKFKPNIFQRTLTWLFTKVLEG